MDQEQTPMPQSAMPAQQPLQPSMQQPPAKSGLAIAGLVLGIIAIVSSWLPIINNLSFFIALVGGILAIIALIGALRGKNSSKGMAIAGVVLNVLSVVFVLAT